MEVEKEQELTKDVVVARLQVKQVKVENKEEKIMTTWKKTGHNLWHNKENDNLKVLGNRKEWKVIADYWTMAEYNLRVFKTKSQALKYAKNYMNTYGTHRRKR